MINPIKPLVLINDIAFEVLQQMTYTSQKENLVINVKFLQLVATTFNEIDRLEFDDKPVSED
jgi:hypothetical protein